jgi:lipoic acid synthetase
VDRYVEPKVFEEYERMARDLGFLAVAAGPFVRSSYKAAQLMDS